MQGLFDSCRREGGWEEGRGRPSGATLCEAKHPPPRSAEPASFSSGLRRRLENSKAATLAQLQRLFSSLASAAAQQPLLSAEAARGAAAAAASTPPLPRGQPTFVPPARPRSCWVCLGKRSPAGSPLFPERRQQQQQQPWLPSPSLPLPRRQRIVTRAEFTCLAAGGLWLHEETLPPRPETRGKSPPSRPPPRPPACV